MSRAGRRTERALARAERRRFSAGRTAGRAQARRVDDSRELWRRQRGYLAACFLFTGRRARLLERRIVSKVHPADWFPPGPDEDRLDFDVQTARWGR